MYVGQSVRSVRSVGHATATPLNKPPTTQKRRHPHPTPYLLLHGLLPLQQNGPQHAQPLIQLPHAAAEAGGPLPGVVGWGVYGKYGMWRVNAGSWCAERTNYERPNTNPYPQTKSDTAHALEGEHALVRLAQGQAPQLVRAEEEPAGGLREQGGMRRVQQRGLEVGEAEGEVLGLFGVFWLMGSGWLGA